MKLFRFLSKLIPAVLLLALHLPASGAGPVVKARLDSVNLQMGRMATIELTVDQPEGTKGSFPIFSSLGETGGIPVCNDSVELRMPVSADTVRQDGFMKITLKVPVQSFDSGFYHLPEFVYVAGKDTVRSNALALKVIPVNAGKDDPIDDYASVSEPENKSLLDHVPDFIYDFWWLIIIILLAIGGLVWLLRKYRKEGHILPRKPEPTPYEKAHAALVALKEKKLWEQGMEKDYFTELTDILRNYLYGRFGINAMEMTSRQILSSLSRNPEIKDKRSYVRQILDMADFVKFAKVRPLPDDNVASYDNAVRFVEETKPVVVEPDGDDKSPDAAAASAKRKKGGGK